MQGKYGVTVAYSQPALLQMRHSDSDSKQHACQVVLEGC